MQIDGNSAYILKILFGNVAIPAEKEASVLLRMVHGVRSGK